MGDTINKGDLSSKIAQATGVSAADAGRMIDAFMDVVGDAVASGDKVVISGWLTFERGHRAARQGINPRTKETIQIAATNTAKVKVGSKLKAKAKG